MKKNFNILCAFLDTNSFGFWYRRADQRNRNDFIHKMREEFKRFQRETHYFFKVYGDGFLTIHKIKKNAKQEARDFMISMWECRKRLASIIEQHSYPRPDGVRVCVAYGDAQFERNPDDWYSDMINLDSKILLIPGKIDFIVHQSARELFPKDLKRGPLQFVKLPKPNWLPPLLDPADANGLFQFFYTEEYDKNI